MKGGIHDDIKYEDGAFQPGGGNAKASQPERYDLRAK